LLVKRAAQVGIVSISLERAFYIWANKVNFKQIEPIHAKSYKDPQLFKKLVFRAVNEEGVNMQRGAELLQVPVSEIKEFCGSLEV
ncbi:MAG: hypothetical protein IJ836_07320, partial [Spirochaetales bacterium]|nr:hypothetical protein [Spirochaetales bacterium]